jgi:hypothetical protein
MNHVLHVFFPSVSSRPLVGQGHGMGRVGLVSLFTQVGTWMIKGMAVSKKTATVHNE